MRRTLGRVGVGLLQHSIYLLKRDRVTTLIIKDIHKRMFHDGINQVLLEFRQEFCAAKRRAAVKKVNKQDCMMYRRWNNQPFQLSEFPSNRKIGCNEPTHSKV